MQVVIITTNIDPVRQVRYLGPYQIAWWIRENGFSAQVLDYFYFFNKEERLTLLKKFITQETKIVAYAPFVILENPYERFLYGKERIFEILEEIKENFPWVKIIIGGMFTKSFLITGWKNLTFKVDGVFKEEGEHTFLEYCEHIFKGGPPITFNVINHQKVFLPKKKYDIQTCNMSFAKNDFIMPGESLPIELSRGCIFKCNFCQYPHIGKDKDDFNKSMDNVRDAFIKNYELFGTTRYHLADDTLNSHRDRTQELHRISKELPFKLEYVGYVRMDLLDIWPEQLDILPESGLVSCHFGVESFHPESCKQIGKGWGGKNHKKWLSYLGEVWGDDVILRCTLIAGLGPETKDNWQETFDWLYNSKVHNFGFSPLYIGGEGDVQSEFDRNLEKYGYKMLSPYFWENKHTTFVEARDWCMSVHKELPKRVIPGAWDYAALKNIGFTKEEIMSSNSYNLNLKRLEFEHTDKFIQNYYQALITY